MNKILIFKNQYPKTSLVLVVVFLLLCSKVNQFFNPATDSPAIATASAEPVVAAKPAVPEAPSVPSGTSAVRDYLRKTLNDWDSYEGEGYSEPSEVADHNGKTCYLIRHEYRAKNGFGAMMLKKQMFYYTSDGVWLVKEAR